MARILDDAGSAPAGHNGGKELTPDERTALRMHHVRKLLEIADRMKPIRDERKTARATAKADGFKLSEIDAAIRLATMDDMGIFVDEIRELIEIAKAFNALPPGEQGDLFPDRRPAEEKAFDAGKVAGLEGKNPEPPAGFDPSKWMDGWHDGQRVMRENLQSAMEKRNAAAAEPSDDDVDEFDDVDDLAPTSIPDPEAPTLN